MPLTVTPDKADIQSLVIEYVGLGPRLLASIVDSVLLMIITLPLLYAIYGPAYFESHQLIQGWMDFLLSYLFPAAAIILFWIYRSATPGKMLINAKIVDADTLDRASNGQLIGRYLAYFVACLPLGLGLLWAAFDRRKQGWHDKLAGTVVVRDHY